jgi:hypothetical protein
MRNFRFACCLLFLLLLPVTAQETGGPRAAFASYKVDFTLRETGPDRSDTRHYTMVLVDGGSSRVNIADRIPVPAGSFQGVGGANPLVNTQYNFHDVGADLNCKLRERDSQVLLDVELSKSSMAPQPGGSPASTTQIRTSTNAALTPGKATEILKWDESQSKRTFVLEVLVTKK